MKKAILLFQRHRTTISNDYGRAMNLDDFVRSHNDIDKDMRNEKAKTEEIKRVFLTIDIFLMMLLPTIEGFLDH